MMMKSQTTFILVIVIGVLCPSSEAQLRSFNFRQRPMMMNDGYGMSMGANTRSNNRFGLIRTFRNNRMDEDTGTGTAMRSDFGLNSGFRSSQSSLSNQMGGDVGVRAATGSGFGMNNGFESSLSTRNNQMGGGFGAGTAMSSSSGLETGLGMSQSTTNNNRFRSGINGNSGFVPAMDNGFGIRSGLRMSQIMNNRNPMGGEMRGGARMGIRYETRTGFGMPQSTDTQTGLVGRPVMPMNNGNGYGQSSSSVTHMSSGMAGNIESAMSASNFGSSFGNGMLLPHGGMLQNPLMASNAGLGMSTNGKSSGTSVSGTGVESEARASSNSS